MLWGWYLHNIPSVPKKKPKAVTSPTRSPITHEDMVPEPPLNTTTTGPPSPMLISPIDNTTADSLSVNAEDAELNYPSCKHRRSDYDNQTWYSERNLRTPTPAEDS